MLFSTSALVLATLAIGQVAAVPSFKHAHFHEKKDATPVATPVARDTELLAEHADALVKLGIATLGQNALTNNGQAWISSDGEYVNEFTNNASHPIAVVVWGPWGSWVNVRQPLITMSLVSGESKNVSFHPGTSGAYSAVHPDTTMIDGQVADTWGEFTFSPTGVVDVSRLPNMNGHKMSIVGPLCETSFDKCVFTCSAGNRCEFGYQLENCAPGSQAGAQYGDAWGAPSGGCGWNGATSAVVKTTFYD